MQTKTIIIIAVIVIIAIGVIWYASSQMGYQIAPQGPGANSENAPDLTTDDSVFSEMEDTSNGLE